MKTYNVTITETASRVVQVEAASLDEAEHKVEQMYKDEEIIIDAEHFDGVQFNAWREVRGNE